MWNTEREATYPFKIFFLEYRHPNEVVVATIVAAAAAADTDDDTLLTHTHRLIFGK